MSMPEPVWRAWIAQARRWEPAGIARLLSVIDNWPQRWPQIEHELFQAPAGAAGPHTRVVGVTGPPGAGKSTLLDKLLENLVARGLRVAVLVVDPSSPFSGGAVLGDRTRIGEVAHHPRVFIRSVASRGANGGLSDSTAAMLGLLRALRFDLVIVESVGAGQSEVAIAGLTDFRAVLCPPGLGDDVQALKAGILEIADVLVISKGDLPGSEATESEMRSAMRLRRTGRCPVVIRVSAASGLGVNELADLMAASTR